MRSGSTLAQVMTVTITWTNVHLSSIQFCGMYLRSISQEVFKNSIHIMNEKITLWNVLPHLPGSNELRFPWKKLRCSNPHFSHSGHQQHWYKKTRYCMHYLLGEMAHNKTQFIKLSLCNNMSEHWTVCHPQDSDIYIYIYNCWKKSKLKSYVRPWFHG